LLMRWSRALGLAWPLLVLAACHGEVDKTPMIDRKIYITDRLYDVQAVSPDQVVIVGYAGKILQTKDGGRNWSISPSGTDDALFKVQLVDGKTGWVVGQGGTIRKTTDGGATWVKQTSGTDVSLFSVYALSPERAIAVGDKSTIIETRDGGATWVALKYE